ncbi:hypothetical protein HS088_TW22G00237 [Tripterygium wilfordii]|uniref:DOMON domain-containing protein n=1 Tax=Tripterygium wilfordii TaxID=458696 RepID=A0A7J7BXK2_TRIWF|nr:cytochrome b561 and DOMON domain-containing protein At3g25290-like [Tripterygium wilfordii]KAF5726558.1 hypothetical protein HS088_TW22G00237 [Tripterygium wilfordii]
MASRLVLTLLALSACFLLILPIHSLTCKSQTFSKNRLYSNCTDLTGFNAFLHYTHNASNSSLSIAFTAVPAKPDGWISWAINPNSDGMIGAQSLIAFKSNGSVTVKPYNLTSYGYINETNLSFQVWDMSAEATATTMTIFATVKVPEKAGKVNQVWQVGPSVTNGVPDKHLMSKENLEAKGALELVSSASASAPASSSPDKAGECGIRTRNLSFYFGFVVALLWSIM